MTGLLILFAVLGVATLYGFATCSHTNTVDFHHEAFGYSGIVRRCRDCGENV